MPALAALYPLTAVQAYLVTGVGAWLSVLFFAEVRETGILSQLLVGYLPNVRELSSSLLWYPVAFVQLVAALIAVPAGEIASSTNQLDISRISSDMFERIRGSAAAL